MMRKKLGLVTATLTVAVAVAFLGAPLGPNSEAQPVCATKGPVLGVSRTIEIDATGGPRYGLQQYPENDLLQDGEVVLTFDDGPLRPHTTAVMQALDRHCTKATFFIVGSQALADPAMVKELAKRGHTIGTHTWSHQYQLRKTNIGRAQHEIELGFSAVQKALGAPVAPFFRFPFLSDSRASLEHLKARNIATFSIDIDAIDYRQKGPDGAQNVFNKIMGELASRKKGILLFHDIQPSTAAALPRILDALKSKGFRVVHFMPTGRAQTLAQYDAMVDTDAARRKLAVAAQPLSPRAVTWPLARQLDPWGNAPQQPASPPGYRPNAIPPPGGGSAVPATAEPQPRPQPRNVEAESDWRKRILGN